MRNHYRFFNEKLQENSLRIYIGAAHYRIVCLERLKTEKSLTFYRMTNNTAAAAAAARNRHNNRVMHMDAGRRYRVSRARGNHIPDTRARALRPSWLPCFRWISTVGAEWYAHDILMDTATPPLSLSLNSVLSALLWGCRRRGTAVISSCFRQRSAHRGRASSILPSSRTGSEIPKRRCTYTQHTSIFHRDTRR